MIPATPTPAKISLGQWTPQKTLDKQTKKVTKVKIMASGRLNRNKAKEKAKKNEE